MQQKAQRAVGWASRRRRAGSIEPRPEPGLGDPGISGRWERGVSFDGDGFGTHSDRSRSVPGEWEGRPAWPREVCVVLFVVPTGRVVDSLSLIHISEPTRLLSISYAVFCLKKKKTTHYSSHQPIINHTH
eukprot:TRINITY_DN37074_c0_g2_i1.p1 TRINITY_DN37074_c0_g2~~TRINITY_DN37074_c0_g2_i1.p1  ORF type:complete len:130 (+),score=5.67 TRINITY_DN37074_c0_g2_i1:307-696(+)